MCLVVEKYVKKNQQINEIACHLVNHLKIQFEIHQLIDNESLEEVESTKYFGAYTD